MSGRGAPLWLKRASAACAAVAVRRLLRPGAGGRDVARFAPACNWSGSSRCSSRSPRRRRRSRAVPRERRAPAAPAAAAPAAERAVADEGGPPTRYRREDGASDVDLTPFVEDPSAWIVRRYCFEGPAFPGRCAIELGDCRGELHPLLFALLDDLSGRCLLLWRSPCTRRVSVGRRVCIQGEVGSSR